MEEETNIDTEVIEQESEETETVEPREPRSIREALEAQFGAGEESGDDYDDEDYEDEEDDEPDTDKTETEADNNLPPVEYPIGWAKENEEFFRSLPREKQAYISQREKESHLKISQLGNKAAKADKWAKAEELLSPYLKQGQDPAALIQNWLVVEQSFVKDPKATIDTLKQYYGLSDKDAAKIEKGLEQSTGQEANQQQSQQPLPPVFNQMYMEIQALKQDKLQREQQAITQSAAQRKQALDQFVNERDNEGNLKHEFIAEVESDMLPHVSLGLKNGISDINKLLSEAYEKAIWANPQTRAKLIERSKTQEEARRLGEQKKQIKSAKKANKLLGSEGRRKPATPSRRSIRAALEDYL